MGLNLIWKWPVYIEYFVLLLHLHAFPMHKLCFPMHHAILSLRMYFFRFVCLYNFMYTSSTWFSPWAPVIKPNGFWSIAFCRQQFVRYMCWAMQYDKGQWIILSDVNWTFATEKISRITNIKHLLSNLFHLGAFAEINWDNLNAQNYRKMLHGFSNFISEPPPAHHSQNLQFLCFNEHKGII